VRRPYEPAWQIGCTPLFAGQITPAFCQAGGDSVQCFYHAVALVLPVLPGMSEENESGAKGLTLGALHSTGTVSSHKFSGSDGRQPTIDATWLTEILLLVGEHWNILPQFSK